MPAALWNSLMYQDQKPRNLSEKLLDGPEPSQAMSTLSSENEPHTHTHHMPTLLHLAPLLLYRVQTSETKMNIRAKCKFTGRGIHRWKVNLHPSINLQAFSWVHLLSGWCLLGLGSNIFSIKFLWVSVRYPDVVLWLAWHLQCFSPTKYHSASSQLQYWR